VFPNLQFCPTGGVSEANAPKYLELACVPCVGGSWLAAGTLLENRDWPAISAAAARAAALAQRG
jgi:2-dehydro-3-deoxyphosphogluconate aldolase/(4S)-4-hydroxy-2-oxoglutarate aldolase